MKDTNKLKSGRIVKDKALLPTKKKMDFTLLSSPGEEEVDKNLPP